jgi:prepilin-type N-terminal cleavage/methylation domain-containing protein
MKTRQSSQGFTLIELVIAMAIVAIVATSQNGYYSIATAVAASTYTVTATPVGGQAGDTSCVAIALSNNGQSVTNSLRCGCNQGLMG